MNPATFRSAYSFLPQAIVAHLINRALYMLDRTLPEGAFPVMQVHDEIVVECDDAQVPAVARLLKQHLELEIQIPGVDVPLLIPAEVSFGQNWMDQEDIEI